MWILSHCARVQIDCLLVLMLLLVNETLFKEFLCAGRRTARSAYRVRFPIRCYLIKRPEKLCRQLHREQPKVARFSADAVGHQDLPGIDLDHARGQSRLITDERVRTENEISRSNDPTNP